MNYRTIPLGPLWTNSYVIDDGRGQALCVDAGGPADAVIAWLHEKKLTLCAILLTHGHMDHILGAAGLKERTGAKLYISKEDAPLLRDPDKNLANDFGYDVRPAEPDMLLSDGSRFSVGAMDLEVIHTPGHTPGSICCVASQGDERLLISGDTLFSRSIGRTDLRGGDDAAMARSLRRLKEIPGDMPVLPGHGPETSLQRERLLNPWMQD